jgi:hypothetical protein
MNYQLKYKSNRFLKNKKSYNLIYMQRPFSIIM